MKTFVDKCKILVDSLGYSDWALAINASSHDFGKDPEAAIAYKDDCVSIVFNGDAFVIWDSKTSRVVLGKTVAGQNRQELAMEPYEQHVQTLLEKIGKAR